MSDKVVEINEFSDPLLLGGKGQRLGELLAMGARVPDGFVVSSAAFQDFMQANTLWDLVYACIRGVDHGDDQALQRAADAIADRIEKAGMPPDLLQAIEQAHDDLCFRIGTLTPKLAVRSSAVGEDAGDASFAGQFETYLGVTGIPALELHVRRVWASLFGPRAIHYRLRNGIKPEATPMAVVVLELVEARAAGVAFSVDPMSGTRDRIVIEGNWGFGESVVQGVVTPDRWEIDKDDLHVLDQVNADKQVVSLFDASTGMVVEAPTPAQFRNAPCLSAAQAQAIGAAVCKVEKAEGYPVDVEWVIPRGWREGDEPVLVQVRPITALASEPVETTWDPAAYATKYGFAR